MEAAVEEKIAISFQPSAISGKTHRLVVFQNKADGSQLQLVLLHQMPERAIGDAEQIGGFGLYAVGALESALQQRAFDACHIALHAHAFGKYRTRRYFGHPS